VEPQYVKTQRENTARDDTIFCIDASVKTAASRALRHGVARSNSEALRIPLHGPGNTFV
jgi:hypothetical protein